MSWLDCFHHLYAKLVCNVIKSQHWNLAQGEKPNDFEGKQHALQASLVPSPSHHLFFDQLVLFSTESS